MKPFYSWLTLSSFLSQVVNSALHSTVCNGLTMPVSLAWLRQNADQAAEVSSSRHACLGLARLVDYLAPAQPGQFGAFFSTLGGHLGTCSPLTCSNGGIHLVLATNRFVTTGGRHVSGTPRPTESCLRRSNFLGLLSSPPLRALLVPGHVTELSPVLLTAKIFFG